MEQGHGDERDAEKVEGAVDDVEGDAGNGAERRRFVEDVGERAAEDLEGFFGAVHGDCALLTDVEGANVVEAEDVVSMTVGEENGIKAIEANAQGLLAEVGSGVDD